MNSDVLLKGPIMALGLICHARATFGKPWKRWTRLLLLISIRGSFGMNTPDNQIDEYARAHPDKVIGFVSVDPRDPQAIEELERCVDDLKLRGIKMSPVYQGYDPMEARAEEIYKRAVRYNLPILIHVAYQSIPQTPMKWVNSILFDEVGIQPAKIRERIFETEHFS